MSPVGTKRTNRTDLMMSVIGPETESGWHTVRGTRMTRSDKSGPHTTSGQRRKRDATNSAPAFCDIHGPASVSIRVAAQHISDYVVAKGERSVVVEQVSEAEMLPVAAVAAPN